MAYSTLPTVIAGDVIRSTTWGDVVKSNFAQIWQYTAKGDLLVGLSATTAQVLPVGTNGYGLVADSAQATGLKWASVGATFKYSDANQVLTASTSFVDVTASSGSFAVAVAANEVWWIDFWLPVTNTASGSGRAGFKFQLTGPSAPTQVLARAWGITVGWNDGGGGTNANEWIALGTPSTTAFSSTFGANSASNGLTNTQWYSGVSYGFVHIHVVVRNGANAGTVTLQVAQNNATDTSTIGAGALMSAQRMG